MQMRQNRNRGAIFPEPAAQLDNDAHAHINVLQMLIVACIPLFIFSCVGFKFTLNWTNLVIML